MSKFTKKFVASIQRYYFSLFLVITVLISFGQMLGMQPWEDDNALFFKLAHLSDPAGFFGKGPLGEGVYKFAAVPFIPIYNIFRYNTVAYFALLILLYIAATLVIYKTFSYILGKSAGRIAGFIYAAGYITADGFWRMANSATTSISIILVCLFVNFYWKYYKSKKITDYLWTFIFFAISINYAVSRTHYLIIVAVVFELLFLTFSKPIKSIIYSLLRLIPFLYVFYKGVILGGDSRSSAVFSYFSTILKGGLYDTYGLFGSLSGLILPDYITNSIFEFQKKTSIFLGFNFSMTWYLLFPASVLLVFFIFRRHQKARLFIPLFSLSTVVWIIVAKHFYAVPIIEFSERGLFSTVFGGILLINFIALLIVLSKNWKILLFLLIWLLGNLAAYTIYNPLNLLESTNRYLAHSFLAEAGLIGFLYSQINKRTIFNYLLASTFIVYGILNLTHNVLYQKEILQQRSLPNKIFFQDLKSKLAVLKKGDVLYFDVSQNKSAEYSAIVAAAMMPDTTTFAWRYNLDRYDFNLVSSFSDLTNLVRSGKVSPENIHAYWYSNEGLIDNSKEVSSYFINKNLNWLNGFTNQLVSGTVYIKNKVGNSWEQPDIEINLSTPMKSATPIELALNIQATPIHAGGVVFPLFSKTANNKNQTVGPQEFSLAMSYRLWLNDLKNKSTYSVSSQWQDRTVKNLYDDDPSTVWQSDRILWESKNGYAQVGLPSIQEINRIYWLSGNYRNSIPTVYKIQTSIDGNNWQEVENTKIISMKNENQHIVVFNPVVAKYMRMVILDTLGGDSPMIAELKVILANLAELDLVKAEDYLNDPFSDIPTEKNLWDVYSGLNFIGKVSISWYGNKENVWLNSKATDIEIVYDGKPHVYKVILPEGGTSISKLKIDNISVPGTISLNGLQYRNYDMP